MASGNPQDGHQSSAGTPHPGTHFTNTAPNQPPPTAQEAQTLLNSMQRLPAHNQNINNSNVNIQSIPDLRHLLGQYPAPQAVATPPMSDSSYPAVSPPTQSPVAVSPGPNTLPLANLLSQFMGAASSPLNQAHHNQSLRPTPPSISPASASRQATPSPTPLAQIPVPSPPAANQAASALQVLNRRKEALAQNGLHATAGDSPLATMLGLRTRHQNDPPHNSERRGPGGTNFTPTCPVCPGPHGWASCHLLKGNPAAQEAVVNHLVTTKQAQYEREENRQSINMLLLSKGIDPTCFGFNQPKQYSSGGLQYFNPQNPNPNIHSAFLQSNIQAAQPVQQPAPQPPSAVPVPTSSAADLGATSNPTILAMAQQLVALMTGSSNQGLAPAAGAQPTPGAIPTSTSVPSVPKPAPAPVINVDAPDNSGPSTQGTSAAVPPGPVPATAATSGIVDVDAQTPADQLKRSRAASTPAAGCTPSPGAQRTRVEPNTEEALFRDLFDVTSTPARAIRREQAGIDLLNDQSTSAAITIEQLSKQLAELQSRQGKSRRHEIGVPDLAARHVLTRSVRALKAGDLLYAIVPSPTGRYELKHSKVANVEGEYVYFTQ